MRGYLPESFQQALGHNEAFLAILARVMIFPESETVVFQNRVSKTEGRIDQYSVTAVQEFSIHCPHRGADNQLRFEFLDQGFQQRKCLGRLNRKVRGNYFCLWQKQPQGFDTAILAA